MQRHGDCLRPTARARITLSILDLTVYEVGNVCLRRFRWPEADVAAQLGDLTALCAVLRPGPAELRVAAQQAEAHGLTFYDALYSATALARGARLATVDHELIKSGAGETPATLVAALSL